MNLPDWTTGGFPPLWEVAQRLAGGKVSSEELVDACEAAQGQWHGIINAMVLSDFGAARAAARDSDRRRRAGQARGVLDGVPFSVKESFDVAGWPTTCGNPALRGHVAQRDAVVVQRLRDAGAILLGKTNVPLGLRDWQSYNAIYGTTRNPHDPTRTPGGSSGGSAAAVCAGVSFFDVGSDIGSSLRNPAHYCGIFSLKPSHGLVPLAGHGAGAARFGEQDINVAGPLARSARDLELVLRTIAGPAGDDALPYRLQWPECPHRRLADFRIAVLPTHAQAQADGEVAAQIERLGHWLAGQGAHVGWHARPDFDAAELWHAYVTLLRATTSVHMDDAAFADALARSATATAGDHDYATLQYTGATLSHRDWLHLQVARERFAAAWRRFFTRYDVLLCPAATTTAFALDEAGEPWQRTLTVNGRAQPMTTQLFWAGHSGLCGLPSAVAPIGRGGGGLPVGVQIVAGRYQDLTALRFASLLEEAGYEYRPLRPPQPAVLPAAHHN